MRKFASCVLVLAVAACSSKTTKKNPDAPVIDDAPVDTAPACGATATAGAPSYLSKNLNQPDILWTSDLPGVGASGDTTLLAFEMYGGIETPFTGTFDLSMGNQANYKTCAVCLHATEFDSMGGVVKEYFQRSGSVMLAVDPITNQTLMGSMSNVVLQEVTIAQDFTSTPVAGGACNGVANLTFNQIAAPMGWTCTAPKFEDGTTCDCMCGTGVQDTDCDVDANSVVGCSTAGDRCFQGGCVTPPTNDTCQTAAVLALATPTAGTTIGANHSYDAGLDTMTCTGFGQPGPDVVYSVALVQGTSYTFTLSGLDAMYDGSIALLDPGAGGTAAVCDAATINTCVKGADAGLMGANETFQYTAATTGVHYLIVDSGYPSGPMSAGHFTITVTSP